MGTGYKGNADHYHSITENLPEMEKAYPYQNGFFGTRGDSKRGSVRHISSDDPQRTAKEFYDKLTFGGKEGPIYDRQGNEHGKKQLFLTVVLLVGEMYQILSTKVLL